MTDTAVPDPIVPPAPTSPRQTRIRWIMLGLIVLTIGCFFQVGKFDFINYDDPKYILDNPDVADGFTFDAFLKSFTSTAGGYRHPVTWWSHLIDVSLFGSGLKTGAAGGHHVMNLLFHTANTTLMFWVLLRLTGAVWPSAWVAAMFAVHPAHIESVAWIAERKDMLSTLFLLLMIWAYAVYTEQKSVGRYLLVVLAFLGALMSKPMMVTAPAILLLLDLWPLRRLSEWKTCILEKLPLFALSIVSGLITIRDTASINSFAGTDQFPLTLRLQTSIIGYARYLGKLVWPTNLSIFYPYPPDGWATGAVIRAIVLFVAITVLAAWQVRKRPYLLVGWLWFVGTLLPVIGILVSGDASLADRYTYVPYIGLFIAIAWGVREIGGKLKQRTGVGVLGGAAVAACAVVTLVNLPHWKNSLAIMGHSKDVVPNNWTAILQYGTALASEKRAEEAADYYRQSLQLRPKLLIAHVQYARYLIDVDRLSEAQQHLREAYSGDPKHPGVLMGLGQLNARIGKHEEALRHYQEAMTHRAGRGEARVLSAVSLTALGRVNEAEKALRDVIAIEPHNAAAHHKLGLLAAARLDGKTALDELALAVDLEPTWGLARFDYGLLLTRVGRSNDALMQFNEALKYFSPKEATNKARAELEIARLLEPTRPMEAAAHFINAVQFARNGVADRPRDPYAQFQLAFMLKQTGQPDEATTVARRAADLATASKNNMVLSMVRSAFPEVVTTQPTTGPATAPTTSPTTQKN